MFGWLHRAGLLLSGLASNWAVVHHGEMMAPLRGDLCLPTNPAMLPRGDPISPLIAAMCPKNSHMLITLFCHVITDYILCNACTCEIMPCRKNEFVNLLEIHIQ